MMLTPGLAIAQGNESTNVSSAYLPSGPYFDLPINGNFANNTYEDWCSGFQWRPFVEYPDSYITCRTVGDNNEWCKCEGKFSMLEGKYPNVRNPLESQENLHEKDKMSMTGEITFWRGGFWNLVALLVVAVSTGFFIIKIYPTMRVRVG